MRQRLPRFTDRLALGTAGLSVSPFCLGMVHQPETVAAAYEAGINFFFVSADMHWPLYEGIRRGLEGLFVSRPTARDDIVVAVVSYTTQPEFCYAPFLEVLEAMPHLAHIDVGVIGGVYASDFTQRLDIYRSHQRARHAGIRAIGATFHDRLAARAALLLDAVDIALLRYNPSHPGACDDVFPYRPSAGRSLLYNFNTTTGAVVGPTFDRLGLNGDYWRPSMADYYRFALTAPQIDGVLCAPQTRDELDALAQALEAGPLDEDEMNYLINLTALAEGRVSLDRDTM